MGKVLNLPIIVTEQYPKGTNSVHVLKHTTLLII